MLVFAALQESGIGTKRTWRDVRHESAFGGKAENIYSERVFRLLTQSGPRTPNSNALDARENYGELRLESLRCRPLFGQLRNEPLKQPRQKTRSATKAPRLRAATRSELQDELTEVTRQRAAISEVLRAIARSPHDLQPIFDTIVDSATRLCRADAVFLRLYEQTPLRLVSYT